MVVVEYQLERYVLGLAAVAHTAAGSFHERVLVRQVNLRNQMAASPIPGPEPLLQADVFDPLPWDQTLP
jgi:hypothetical protein